MVEANGNSAKAVALEKIKRFRKTYQEDLTDFNQEKVMELFVILRLGGMFSFNHLFAQLEAKNSGLVLELLNNIELAVIAQPYSVNGHQVEPSPSQEELEVLS